MSTVLLVGVWGRAEHAGRNCGGATQMTAIGFEPMPLRTGAWNQRLRPLGKTVVLHWHVFLALPLSHGSPHHHPPRNGLHPDLAKNLFKKVFGTLNTKSFNGTKKT